MRLKEGVRESGMLKGKQRKQEAWNERNENSGIGVLNVCAKQLSGVCALLLESLEIGSCLDHRS